MKFFSILIGSAASAFMLTSGMSAVAQQPMPQQRNPQQQAPSSSESNSKVPEEEFQRFAKAFQAVQSIQNQSREDIKQAIKDQGLTLKEYKQFVQQQPQSNNGNANSSNFSQQKQQKIQQAQARIEEISKETQGKIKDAIAKEGFQMKRFQAIWKTVKNDRKLQQKLLQQMQNN
ncbi:MAG: hypothetical protein BRC33_01470 [Cyanobacteria bacterium SW_9_44_58]|nr:MAG: hypothetical protein BRC33_01470 [Cyanobacteria bacterium SW_9_44_58]